MTTAVSISGALIGWSAAEVGVFSLIVSPIGPAHAFARAAGCLGGEVCAVDFVEEPGLPAIIADGGVVGMLIEPGYCP